MFIINSIIIIIIIIIILYNIYDNTQENFRPCPIWNISTRIPRLYYDIRGDPNIVYRQLIFGNYEPYGYLFGPYLYDAQGNLIILNSHK
jgi:hypothetical protein